MAPIARRHHPGHRGATRGALRSDTRGTEARSLRVDGHCDGSACRGRLRSVCGPPWVSSGGQRSRYGRSGAQKGAGGLACGTRRGRRPQRPPLGVPGPREASRLRGPGRSPKPGPPPGRRQSGARHAGLAVGSYPLGLCWPVAPANSPGHWAGPGSWSLRTAGMVSRSVSSRLQWSPPQPCGGPPGDLSAPDSIKRCVPCSVPHRWGYRWCSLESG